MRTKLETLSYFLLRIVAGFMFFQAGAMKTFGWYGGIPGDTDGRADLATQVGIGGAIEVIGGILIMLGLGTRPVAFILSGQMAVAYFQFHQPGGTWPLQNGGVSAVLFCFLFFYMIFKGAGPWSLDAQFGKKRS